MQQLQPLLGVLYGFTGFVLERTTSPSETYDVDREGHRRQLLVAALATLDTAFLLFAAGATFILLSFVIYAPATILFVLARREQRRQLFSPREQVILVVSVPAVTRVARADAKTQRRRNHEHQ